MMEKFCLSANLKKFLKRPDIPEILQQCKRYLGQVLDNKEIHGTLDSDIRIFLSTEDGNQR